MIFIVTHLKDSSSDDEDDEELYEEIDRTNRVFNATPSNHKGWIFRKAPFYQAWHQKHIKYFGKIRDNKLLLFNDPRDESPKERILLMGAEIRTHKYKKNFLLMTQGSKHVLSQKLDAMETWILELEKAISLADGDTRDTVTPSKILNIGLTSWDLGF